MVLIFPSRMGIAISIPAGKHLNPILFLDKNAFISSLVIPGYLMALMTFFYLFRTAVLSKYLVGFQPDNRLRDKMRRKSAIQIILFSKVKLSQLKVPLSANTTSESCAVKGNQKNYIAPVWQLNGSYQISDYCDTSENELEIPKSN
ncbi:hypothetical protein HUJ05_003747 [Dendroctonus ponderosae]|nr:hypothetical protein HUJ05_003747 [Dendroctonus ponderosae]